MGCPNWIENLTTTRLEARFTWRFEGLLGEFRISSRWISFHSPALKYLEILGNAFCATWPGNIIQMMLDDIWHQTPGVGQQWKHERQGFEIRVPGTDSLFSKAATHKACQVDHVMGLPILAWTHRYSKLSFSMWPLSAKWGTAQSYYGIVHRFVW